MANATWTKEQERAITRRGQSLLVSAAAGAGKTAVLVERIIRRILDPHDPVDVDSLLVVTFTNAAAREMKERVGKALEEWCRQNPEDKRMERQRLLLDRARISTMHSFCLDLIRTYYYELKLPGNLSLDPRFRIAEETESALLRLETLDELLESRYADGEQAFIDLVEVFGGDRDDKILQNLVLRLFDYSCSQPNPTSWLQESSAVFSAGLAEESLQKLFTHLLAGLALPLEEAYDKLTRAAALCRRVGGPTAYLPVLEEEAAAIRLALQKTRDSWTGLADILRDFRFVSLKPCRGEVDQEIKKEVQSLRNGAKKTIQDIKEDYFSRTPAEMKSEMEVMAPHMETLCGLVADFRRGYLEAKFARNVLDFSDIEHLALNLLQAQAEGAIVPSHLAVSLKNRYREVLVDEYQDINSVQETLINLVSRAKGENPGLFMVGDVKQSIYGFRLANPGLFLEKYHRFQQVPDESPDKEIHEEKILLSRNFRSAKYLVDGINYLFRQIMSPQLGGLAYDPGSELVFGAVRQVEESAEQTIEVCLIERNSPGDNGERPENISNNNVDDDQDEDDGTEDFPAENLPPEAMQMEARLIARRIEELTANGQKAYRDIVILLRSAKGAAPIFLEEFRLKGIPAYAETGAGYFEAQEVQTILSLLKILDNPRQDIPLTAVLHSPLVGLSASDLTSIRLTRPRGDYYNAARLAARREEGQLGTTLREFLKDLQRWRTMARRGSLAELLWTLYRETGFYDYVGALPGGRQRQANLRALQDRATQFEQSAMKGLFRFLRFLERLQESESDLGAARAIGENEDVVRIMSIHKSKGLEFPVVFLAGLGKKFNLRDLNEDILVDRDLGLGPNLVDPVRRLKYPTLAKLAVRNKLEQDQLAEEMRILYVALTRARDKLILVGAIKGIGKKLRQWSHLFDRAESQLPLSITGQAGSFWDWIAPCLLRHADGRALRRLAGGTADEYVREPDELSRGKDSSRWKINIVPGNELANGRSTQSSDYAQELAAVSRLEPVETCDPIDPKIFSGLSWNCGSDALNKIPAKMTVTELKNKYAHLLQDPDSVQVIRQAHAFSQRPQFMQKEDMPLSAGERGSALHLVMRHLDLEKELLPVEIRRQIRELVMRELLTKEQGEAVDEYAAARFFLSELGQKMQKTPRIWREVSFTLALPANEIYPQAKLWTEEKIILQGTMDVLMEEDDSLVLVDYKTDLISQDTVDLFRERYRIQMELYAKAARSILGLPVREKYLYSFSLGEAILL